MKKVLLTILVLIGIMVLGGCTQAERVSENLSKEADNFNVVRQVTVINGITGDTLFQMTGRIAIFPDTEENQLEIIAEYKKGEYKKHFIGLSDNVTYVVEQLNVKNVSNYQYTLNFNPKMWIPVDIKTID